jgi:hypothetical protein
MALVRLPSLKFGMHRTSLSMTVFPPKWISRDSDAVTEYAPGASVCQFESRLAKNILFLCFISNAQMSVPLQL